MEPDHLPVTCLVVTYNSERQIESCLEALLRTDVAQVLIWDNCSTDATRARLAAVEDPRVTVTYGDANTGFAAAVNRLADAAVPGHHLLLLNPDCVLPQATFDGMRVHLEGNPRVGMVAPAMTYPDGVRGFAGGNFPSLAKELLAVAGIDRIVPRGLVDRFSASPLVSSSRFGQLLATRTLHRPLEVDWVSGFCMLIRRSAWEDAGPLDDRFFLYFEDVALCRTARDRGWEAWALLQFEARHEESASSTPRSKGEFYRRSMWQYFGSHGTAVQRATARVVKKVRP